MQAAYENIPRTVEFVPLRAHIRHAAEWLRSPSLYLEHKYLPRLYNDIERDAMFRHLIQQRDARNAKQMTRWETWKVCFMIRFDRLFGRFPYGSKAHF